MLSILPGLDSASLYMENRWVCLVICLCVSQSCYLCFYLIVQISTREAQFTILLHLISSISELFSFFDYFCLFSLSGLHTNISLNSFSIRHGALTLLGFNLSFPYLIIPIWTCLVFQLCQAFFCSSQCILAHFLFPLSFPQLRER